MYSPLYVLASSCWGIKRHVASTHCCVPFNPSCVVSTKVMHACLLPLLVAFCTQGWPQPSRRDLIAAGVGSVIGGAAMFIYDTREQQWPPGTAWPKRQ